MRSVSAILLAAGESTRMGRQKALLPWGGVTLLEYQLAQLAALEDIAEVIVVTGHDPDQVAEIAAANGARVVHNGAYRSGKVSSIVAGLRAVPPSGGSIMLLAVDQPRSSATLAIIVDAHMSAGALITVPAHGGHRGHPVIFASTLLPELTAIREETQGIRDVLRRHAAEVQEVELADADVLLDVNEPSALPRTTRGL